MIPLGKLFVPITLGVAMSLSAAAPVVAGGGHKSYGHYNNYHGGHHNRHYPRNRHHKRHRRGHYKDGYAVGAGILLGLLVGSAINSHYRRHDDYGQYRRYDPYDQRYAAAPPPAPAYPSAQQSAESWQGTCLQVREYQTTVMIGGKEVEAYGPACLQPDGSWKRGPTKIAQY